MPSTPIQLGQAMFDSESSLPSPYAIVRPYWPSFESKLQATEACTCDVATSSPVAQPCLNTDRTYNCPCRSPLRDQDGNFPRLCLLCLVALPRQSTVLNAAFILAPLSRCPRHQGRDTPWSNETLQWTTLYPPRFHGTLHEHQFLRVRARPDTSVADAGNSGPLHSVTQNTFLTCKRLAVPARVGALKCSVERRVTS